jgi:hypothetical protein
MSEFRPNGSLLCSGGLKRNILTCRLTLARVVGLELRRCERLFDVWSRTKVKSMWVHRFGHEQSVRRHVLARRPIGCGRDER